MILGGILHSSLGGFTVIRGVAPLGELERCSRFDPAYQRNLIETHKAEIERFLADRQFLFFPEVVLSASLRFDYERTRGRAVQPLADLFARKSFISNVDGLKISVQQGKLPKSLETVGSASAPTLAYLELSEDELAKGDEAKLFRIDGNHRLSAAKGLKPGEDTYSLGTPFCIVLHQDPTLARQFEKVVFHNINAKQIPLTSEENLRLILESGPEALFKDSELVANPSLGPAYLLARKLLPEFDARFLSGFKRHFQNRYTLALGLAQFLAARDEEIDATKTVEGIASLVEKVRDALKRANAMYEDPGHERLRESGCHGVLTAAVFFAYKNAGAQLPAFSRWITSNRIDRLTPGAANRGLGYHYHLGQTQAVDAASLVEVFESILKARSRDVFVSMDFGTHSEHVYKAIEKAIQDVNTKHSLARVDLALKPIRIDRVIKGHSYTIDDEILNVIDGSGLLIADLSQGNKNVYHEVGFMMGLNKGRGGEQDNFILLVDNNKLKDDKDIAFNLRPWQQLRFGNDLDLVRLLTESFEKHYGLQ